MTQLPRPVMTDEDQAPIYSLLSQSVMRDGNTVQVEIFEDGEGGWLLEVVDDYGTRPSHFAPPWGDYDDRTDYVLQSRTVLKAPDTYQSKG